MRVRSRTLPPAAVAMLESLLPRTWSTWALVAALAVVAVLAAAGPRPASRLPGPPPTLLPAVHAAGGHVDTLFVGGYARGSFAQAMRVLARGASPEERTLVGHHLDRVFAGVLEQNGLGGTGRLRVAYERTVRPDGSVRAVRVLVAEAAAGGEMHTAFYHEEDGKPGYYDPFGRSLEERAWSGPLRGELRVTSGFLARRMHPILHRILPHAGVDYAAPSGMPVYATGDGFVSEAGPRGGYGNMVEIQHPNGYTTRYAHLSSVAARRGGMVRQGDLVGFVGATGLATGPHLHYEVRRDGRAVDPVRATAAATLPELRSGAAWSADRNRLARLLGRTPTMVRAEGI